MADHDPMCPATIADGRWRARCECDLIARVRADEREQVGRVWAKREDLRDAASNESHLAALEARDHELAHAEAVAAKLVEVICDDAAVMAWDLKALEATARERDAARAEVERLRSPEWEAEVRADERAKVYRPDAHRMMLERDAARAEVAALRDSRVLDMAEVARQCREAEAKRLADLRAKVESGWVPELDHEARIAVLALIEEASND